VALPNGNIFFGAAGRPGGWAPTHFFEFNVADSIVQRADSPDGVYSAAYFMKFLMLPTGQVLLMKGNANIEIYTPAGTYQASWQPVITSIQTTLTRGKDYQVTGTQLTGVTHGSSGGNAQAATNFPLVRVTKNSSKAVYFARTFAFSTRSDKPGQASSARFEMPASDRMPAGDYTLNVIANGIPSDPVTVRVD
jgi:hypothetical protein